VIGTTATLSWLPSAADPFEAKVPTTVKVTRLILICWPTGSWPWKRLSTTVWPTTTTLELLVTSAAVNMAPVLMS